MTLRTVRASLGCALALVCLCSFAASSSAQTAELKESDRAASRSRESDSAIETSASIRIGAGDLLEVKVFGAPELGNTLRVSSEGEIAIALIGSVRIAGLTPEQAQTEIEQRFRDGGYLRNPHVSILVKVFPFWERSLIQECILCSERLVCSTPLQLPAAQPRAPATRL